MSSRWLPTVNAEGGYSPIDRLETRSQRFAELLVVGGAATGFALSNGRLGVAAGLVLLGCWTRLRVELTFIVGAVLVAVLGGDISTPGSLLTVAGLCGLLTVDLVRAWVSAQPAALFLVSTLSGVLVGVPAYNRLGPYWFTLGAAGVILIGLYGLYWYERYISQSAPDDETGDEFTGDVSPDRSSSTEQQPDAQ